MTGLFLRIKNKLFPSEQQRIFNQWFADGGDERYRYDYDLNSGSLVLDLGGYEGDWTAKLLSRVACRIIVFEPVPEFAARISSRFSANEMVEVNAFGLGSHTRRETIHLGKDGSSVFQKGADTTEIELVDVRSWFDERQFERVDLMKINIEGGEFELLERMLETGLIDRIANIQVQFHSFVPDAEQRMVTIQRQLERTHRLSWQYRFVWENWCKRAFAQ